MEDVELLEYDHRLTKCDLSPNFTVFYDESTNIMRTFVPVNLRNPIIESLHSLSHLGCKATCKIEKQRYFWPGIERDVKTFVRNCISCQQHKVNGHIKSTVEPINAPADRFQTVHID